MTAQPELTRERARRMRREQTDAEIKLWSRVRARKLAGVKFRRQGPIGPFIADFAAPERKLVIELDGGQHADQAPRYAARTAYLNGHGYRVVRFWDHEVLLDLENVVAQIISFL